MATPLVVPVYLALLALPPAYGEHESVSAREMRLATVAVAIDQAADGDDEMAAALIETAWGETRIAKRWHEMGPRRDTKGFAVSLWSLHETVFCPHDVWIRLGGIGGTEEAAQIAAAILREFHRRCRDWAGAFSMFASGKSCSSWKGAGQREYMRRRILRWIRSVETQQ